jgi:hypothetical protein
MVGEEQNRLLENWLLPVNFQTKEPVEASNAYTLLATAQLRFDELTITRPLSIAGANNIVSLVAKLQILEPVEASSA